MQHLVRGRLQWWKKSGTALRSWRYGLFVWRMFFLWDLKPDTNAHTINHLKPDPSTHTINHLEPDPSTHTVNHLEPDPSTLPKPDTIAGR